MLRFRRALSFVVALALAASTFGCSGSGDGSGWRQIGDIDHLLAGDLPNGWVVSSATLRPGRPTSEWAYRADVFVDDDTDELVIVTASDFTPPGRDDLPPGSPPGDPVDVAVDDLWYLFAYAGVSPPEGAGGRRIGWRSGSVTFEVIRFAPGPSDDELLRDSAQALAKGEDLDFGHPEAITGAGFTLASTITDTEDVADYTITWTHRDDAGSSREEARERRDGAPRLWLNVGARMYVPVIAAGGPIAEDPQDAEVRRDGDSLELTFLRDGLAVRIGGSAVEPDALRALARSLREVSLEEWTRELGDRLFVDEPEER